VSETFEIVWHFAVEKALTLFDPNRWQQLIQKLWNILHEELNQAVSIVKAYLIPVKTGYMQSRYGIIDTNPDQMWILVGTEGVPYAVYVEFGTRKMHARPFHRPAVWEAFFRIRERCEAAVQEWARV
jgi:hypothetical protein